MNFPGISSWRSRVLLFPVWFACVTFFADWAFRWFIFNEGRSFVQILCDVVTDWWLYYFSFSFSIYLDLPIDYQIAIFGGILGFYFLWIFYKKWYFLIGSAVFCLFFTNFIECMMSVV